MRPGGSQQAAVVRQLATWGNRIFEAEEKLCRVEGDRINQSVELEEGAEVQEDRDTARDSEGSGEAEIPMCVALLQMMLVLDGPLVLGPVYGYLYDNHFCKNYCHCVYGVCVFRYMCAFIVCVEVLDSFQGSSVSFHYGLWRSNSCHQVCVASGFTHWAISLARFTLFFHCKEPVWNSWLITTTRHM